MAPDKSMLDFFDDLSHPDPGGKWFEGNDLQPLHTDDPVIKVLLEQTLEERRSFIRKFEWGLSTQWEERRKAFVSGLLAYEKRFEQLLNNDVYRQTNADKPSTTARPGEKDNNPEQGA